MIHWFWHLRQFSNALEFAVMTSLQAIHEKSFISAESCSRTALVWILFSVRILIVYFKKDLYIIWKGRKQWKRMRNLASVCLLPRWQDSLGWARRKPGAGPQPGPSPWVAGAPEHFITAFPGTPAVRSGAGSQMQDASFASSSLTQCVTTLAGPCFNSLNTSI